MRRILLAGLAAAFSLTLAAAVPAHAATPEDCKGENCAPAGESSKRGCGHNKAATS